MRAVWDLVVLVEGATAPAAVKRAILLVIFGTKFIIPQGLQSSHFLELGCGEKSKKSLVCWVCERIVTDSTS